MENNQNYQNGNNYQEKEIIICLIIISIILLYVGIWFMHNIIDRGGIDSSKVVPNNIITDDKNNTIDDNNLSDNNNTSDDNNLVDNNNRGNNWNGNANNQTGDNNKNNDNNDKNSGEVVDYSDTIKINQISKANGKKQSFQTLKELDIFKNIYFDGRSMIAPGVKGTYNFTVENESNVDFIYEIGFIEKNDYNINMVYKIKRNGKYIIGNESEWIEHQNFIKSDLNIKANTTDLYTIEWKWEDAENDTEIGQTEGAKYIMSIDFTATQVTQ